MATFVPIPYTYVPTVPRSKSASTRLAPVEKPSGIPDRNRSVEPSRALFCSTQPAAVARAADYDSSDGSEIREVNVIRGNVKGSEDYSVLDLPTLCTASPKDVAEDSSLAMDITDDGSSPMGRTLIPHFRSVDSTDRLRGNRGIQGGPLIPEDDESNDFGCKSSSIPPLSVSGLSNKASDQPQPHHHSPQLSLNDADSDGDDEMTQSTLELPAHRFSPVLLGDDHRESNGSVFGYEVGLFPIDNDEDNLSATVPSSSSSHHLVQPSPCQIGWEQNESDFSYGISEQPRRGSLLDIAENNAPQQHGGVQCTQENICSEDPNQGEKRYRIVESGKDSDDEMDEAPQPANRQRAHLKRRPKQPHHHTSSSSTHSDIHAARPLDFDPDLPQPIDRNHSCSSQASSCNLEPAPIADYQEWPFQGFLKRTRFGNRTTYNLEFELQHVPEHLHLPITSMLSNSGNGKTMRTKTPTLSGAATHSRVQQATVSNCSVVIPFKKRPGTLQAKKKRVPWKTTEDRTIMKLKKRGYSWEDIQRALPHRTQERSRYGILQNSKDNCGGKSF